MRWNLKYAIRSYITSSMWLVPLAAILFYLVFQWVTYALGGWLLRTGGSIRRRRSWAFRWTAHAPCSRR